MHPELIDTLVIPNTTKIVFLIMDGLGGLPGPEGMTELETAQTPHLDALAKKGVCGLLDPVGYGITPGSGPAHFALFGYDPVKNNIGRGILEGAGIDFPMTEKDLLIRINFATMNSDGMIVDRRAGRIDNETNRRICKKLQDNIPCDGNVEVIFQSVKEHRAVLVLRGDGLAEEIQETDPQQTGRAPLSPQALVPEAKYTEAVLSSVINRAREVLSAEPKANMMLLRGYAKYRKYASLKDRYLLNALAIASYPMYRGIARLLGMNIARHTETVAEEIALLREYYRDHDFFFVHVKATDSRGEDGNFDGKVAVIEELDAMLPQITELKPDVLVVTGDHSTPAVLASHSWHPVPVILSAPTCRPDMVGYFAERDCIRGSLGRMPMMYLMAQALAHAKRLEKFGA